MSDFSWFLDYLEADTQWTTIEGGEPFSFTTTTLDMPTAVGATIHSDPLLVGPYTVKVRDENGDTVDIGDINILENLTITAVPGTSVVTIEGTIDPGIGAVEIDARDSNKQITTYRSFNAVPPGALVTSYYAPDQPAAFVQFEFDITYSIDGAAGNETTSNVWLFVINDYESLTNQFLALF